MRQMPIAGGAVTTLATFGGITAFTLDGVFVLFSVESNVYSINTRTGELRLRASGLGTITSLSAVGVGYLNQHSVLLWTEQDGLVVEKDLASPENGDDGGADVVFVPGAGYTSTSANVFHGNDEQPYFADQTRQLLRRVVARGTDDFCRFLHNLTGPPS